MMVLAGFCALRLKLHFKRFGIILGFLLARLGDRDWLVAMCAYEPAVRLALQLVRVKLYGVSLTQTSYTSSRNLLFLVFELSYFCYRLG